MTTYICQGCGKTYTVKQQYERHLTRVRKCTSKVCPNCGTVFSTKRNCDYHIQHMVCRRNVDLIIEGSTKLENNTNNTNTSNQQENCDISTKKDDIKIAQERMDKRLELITEQYENLRLLFAYKNLTEEQKPEKKKGYPEKLYPNPLEKKYGILILEEKTVKENVTVVNIILSVLLIFIAVM